MSSGVETSRHLLREDLRFLLVPPFGPAHDRLRNDSAQRLNLMAVTPIFRCHSAASATVAMQHHFVLTQ